MVFLFIVARLLYAGVSRGFCFCMFVLDAFRLMVIFRFAGFAGFLLFCVVNLLFVLFGMVA